MMGKLLTHLLYLNVIILCSASSDWCRKSRDRENKTSCLLGSNYHITPLQKYRDFYSKGMTRRYENPIQTIKLRIFSHFIPCPKNLALVYQYLCSTFGRFIIKVHITVREVKLKSMKGKLSKIYSLTQYRFSLEKITGAKFFLL